MQDSQRLVTTLIKLGLKPSLVPLRPSIRRWMQTLNPGMVAGTLHICASLGLSLEDTTVATILSSTEPRPLLCAPNMQNWTHGLPEAAERPELCSQACSSSVTERFL